MDRGNVRNMSVLILLSSCQQTCMTYTITVCTVKNSWWWTEELSETCRILFRNKFVNWGRLVGFIIRIQFWRQNLRYTTISWGTLGGRRAELADVSIALQLNLVAVCEISMQSTKSWFFSLGRSFSCIKLWRSQTQHCQQELTNVLDSVISYLKTAAVSFYFQSNTYWYLFVYI